MPFGVAKRGVGRPATGHESGADRKANVIASRQLVDRLPCADPARRSRLEGNDEEWLRWYCVTDFWLPFEKPHKAIIEKARIAMTTGIDAVVAAERGIGKSFTMFGMVFKYAISGEQRFPVYIPWSQKDQDQGIRFWLDCLCNNERIAADYPEVCAPFVHAQGIAQRLITTRWGDTGELTGARSSIGQGRAIIVFPDGRGLIGSSSMGGNPRGMHYKPKGAASIRPTMALIDDIQDDHTAHSPDGVRKTIEKVNGAIRGMKRAGSDFSILMSGNCIAPGDVMDHFLNQAGWSCVRVACVEQWPDGWEDPHGETRRLWDAWGELFHGGKGEVTFYRKNRHAMKAGMIVSSPRWYKESLKTKGRDQRKRFSPAVDCCHGVMRDYYRMGHEAFMAERQQRPVERQVSSYDLTPAMIVARKSGYARLNAPAGSVIVCGCDLNYIGLNWSVVAADTLTTTRRVVAYGVWPGGGRALVEKGATDEQAGNVFRKAIGELARTVLAPMLVKCGEKAERVSDACFDASNGKWQQAVVAACRESRYGVRLHALKAFGHDKYKPMRNDLRAGRGWRLAQWPQLGTVLVVDADFWRETMQRGLLVETTEAGAVSLYDPQHSHEHDALAVEIAGERLIEHVTTDKGEYYKWVRTPGVANDRADALVYACALTGVMGIGEHRPAARRYVEMRKCKVHREM